ncbi:hypothetical protein EWM64_g8391 [Hericium alpestre]|uniref:Uncharacterized protein n=1 Tax=Hericium alpestre TaxID=135208 RepID=A0A4Y9ZNQ4_9AGAM|nr:hypothetical protein EWM64_g8391 [Hericium alpestre]
MLAGRPAQPHVPHLGGEREGALTRSIQNHKRSRSLPLPTWQAQWVCGQAVHRFQNPARSQSLPPATSTNLCAPQAVPSRRATDLPSAAHSSRTSMPPLHSTCPRPAAVPSSLSSASSPPCAGAGGACQSKPTAGTMFVAGSFVTEPQQHTYTPFPSAPATDVVDAMSVLVEFLEVAQLVSVLCNSLIGTVPPAVHRLREAPSARNGEL